MATMSTEVATSFEVFQMALEIVMKSENVEDLCRKFVHAEYLQNVARGAYIYTLNNRSNLIEAAGYGQPFIEGVAEISAWDENPASNAVRGKRQTFSKGDAKTGKPAVVCIPYLKDSVPVGVCAIVLDPKVESSPFSDEVAPALGKLGAYFLETRGVTPRVSSPTGGRESIEDLTTRQVTILGYMGDGLTNADISTKVLLSESTVRQETIRIYRALAVSGRQEAVAKGRALGLIQKLTFTPPPPPPDQLNSWTKDLVK